MPKKVHHVVKRPGRVKNDPDVLIPIAEDLATVPGSPVREKDVTFYSREFPIESQTVEKAADREWAWTVFTDDLLEYRKKHEAVSEPLIDAAAVSGEIEPTVLPDEKIDFTASIRDKARDLGFGEVGFTIYDRRYTYSSKKNGQSTKTLFAWRSSRITTRPKRSRASRQSLHTSEPTKSPETSACSLPSTSAHWAFTHRSTAPTTTAGRSSRCS